MLERAQLEAASARRGNAISTKLTPTATSQLQPETLPDAAMSSDERRCGRGEGRGTRRADRNQAQRQRCAEVRASIAVAYRIVTTDSHGFRQNGIPRT